MIHLTSQLHHCIFQAPIFVVSFICLSINWSYHSVMDYWFLLSLCSIMKWTKKISVFDESGTKTSLDEWPMHGRKSYLCKVPNASPFFKFRKSTKGLFGLFQTCVVFVLFDAGEKRRLRLSDKIMFQNKKWIWQIR